MFVHAARCALFGLATLASLSACNLGAGDDAPGSATADPPPTTPHLSVQVGNAIDVQSPGPLLLRGELGSVELRAYRWANTAVATVPMVAVGPRASLTHRGGLHYDLTLRSPDASLALGDECLRFARDLRTMLEGLTPAPSRAALFIRARDNALDALSLLEEHVHLVQQGGSATVSRKGDAPIVIDAQSVALLDAAIAGARSSIRDDGTMLDFSVAPQTLGDMVTVGVAVTGVLLAAVPGTFLLTTATIAVISSAALGAAIDVLLSATPAVTALATSEGVRYDPSLTTHAQWYFEDVGDVVNEASTNLDGALEPGSKEASLAHANVELLETMTSGVDRVPCGDVICPAGHWCASCGAQGDVCVEPGPDAACTCPFNDYCERFTFNEDGDSFTDHTTGHAWSLNVSEVSSCAEALAVCGGKGMRAPSKQELATLPASFGISLTSDARGDNTYASDGYARACCAVYPVWYTATEFSDSRFCSDCRYLDLLGPCRVFGDGEDGIADFFASSFVRCIR